MIVDYMEYEGAKIFDPLDFRLCSDEFKDVADILDGSPKFIKFDGKIEGDEDDPLDLFLILSIFIIPLARLSSNSAFASG